jgi:DNA excision repair protein ERCC-4
MKAVAINPVIVIDSREQSPLVFKRFLSERGTLSTGDYSIRGAEELFSIERKSIADLVSCCAGSNRERFERELHRLRGFWFARLLIVGSEADVEAHRYASHINPNSVLHTVRAFEARYVPVVWAPCPERAGELVQNWAYWFCHELAKVNEPLLRSMDQKTVNAHD